MMNRNKQQTLRPGMPMRELERWAEEHSVQHWLRASVDAVDKRNVPRADQYWLWMAREREVRLGEALTARTLGGARWRLRSDLCPRPVQLAVIETLLQAAEITRRGVAEEPARAARRRAPADPALLALYERLETARAEIRSAAAPRPLNVLGPISVELEDDPPIIRYVERVNALCGNNSEPEVRIELRPPAKGMPVLSCDCMTRPPTGRCSVVLAALDHALDLIGVPEQSDQAERIREILMQPPWAPTLRALDRSLPFSSASTAAGLDAAAPVGGAGHADERPCWLVENAEPDEYEDIPKLTPALCKPYKQRPGTNVGSCRWSQFEAALRHHHTAADQAAYDLLATDQHITGYSWMSADVADDALHLRALAELAGSPRVFRRGRGREGLPLTIRRSVLSLHWCKMVDGGVEVLARVVGRDVEPGEFVASVWGSPAGGLLALRDGEGLILVSATSAAVGLVKTLAKSGYRFPADALSSLLARLGAVARIVPVELDETLRGEQVESMLRPTARLAVGERGSLQVRFLVRPLAGGERYVPGLGDAEVYGELEQRRIFACRDLEQETEETRTLAAGVGLTAEQEAAPFAWVVDDHEAALEVVARLQEAGDEIAVEWLREERYHVAGTASPADLKIQVRKLEDWFKVGGELRLGSTLVPLEALLDAARHERGVVSVDGATWVRLDAALRRCLRSLADVVESGEERTSALRAPAIDAIAREAGATIRAPRAWNELLARVRQSADVDCAPPPGLRAELRPYQIEGQAWLSRSAVWSPGVCLADDMGLGKTVQTLALLLRRAELGPALVVTPTSVGFNWIRETKRFAPSLRVLTYRGRARKELLDNPGKGQLLVTSYQLVQRDIDQLAPIAFATVVLDESQAIKNPDTQRARAIRRLQSGLRVDLTGTPLENRLSELWSLFQVLAPGLLGSRQRFRERFVIPIERDADDERRRSLARLIRPFILRRTKSEVAPDLPPRTEIVVEVELSPAERRLYEETRGAALVALAGGTDEPNQQRFQVLAALTRLRQIACHPQLVAPHTRAGSAKLTELRTQLHELRAEGHRALIFSQFTRHLALVREALRADGIDCRYLDGSTPERRRRAEVDAFQSGQGDVFLISLKAGGTGLNLTAATYVFHLDPWWNPAVEDQATDRAHRIGQEHPVTVYRLVARDTVEESILALHDEKRKLVAGVLDGTGAAGALSTEDLVELLRAGAVGAPRRSGAEPVLEVKPLKPAPELKPTEGNNPPVTAGPRPEHGQDSRSPLLFEELDDAFATQLEREAAVGRTSPQTVAIYQRIGDRFFDYLADHLDVPPAAEEMLQWGERYAVAVRGREIEAPISDAQIVTTVARRMAKMVSVLSEDETID